MRGGWIGARAGSASVRRLLTGSGNFNRNSDYRVLSRDSLLPAIERLLRDPDLAADISHRHPATDLLQHRRDLLDRKARLLHGTSSWPIGRIVPQNSPGVWSEKPGAPQGSAGANRRPERLQQREGDGHRREPIQGRRQLQHSKRRTDYLEGTGPLMPKCVHSSDPDSRADIRPSTRMASSASTNTPDNSVDEMRPNLGEN